MRKVREILQLKYEVGLSHRAIARALTVGVGSVSAYAERARLAGLSWPLPEELDETRLWRAGSSVLATDLLARGHSPT